MADNFIYATDPAGKLHKATAGTPLPKGWKPSAAPSRVVPGSDPTKQSGFMQSHPKTREAILGAFSGLGVPETMNPVTDLVKGIGHLFTPPESTDEKVASALGPGLPAYRAVKGLGQQTYGFGKDILTGSPEQKAHGVAGLTTELGSMFLGGKKAPEAVADAAKIPGRIAESVDAGRVGKATGELKNAITSGVTPDFGKHLDRAISKGYLHDIEKTVKPKDMRAAAEAVLDRADRIQKDVVKPAINRHPFETVSGDEVGKVVNDIFTPEMEKFFPEALKKIAKETGRYAGKPITLPEANFLIEKLNAINRSLDKAAPESSSAAQRVNVSKAASKAAVVKLRELLYDKLEQLGEPNIREAQKDYGSLREVGEAMRKNVTRAERVGKGPSLAKSAFQKHPWMTLGAIAGAGLAHPSALAIPFMQWVMERRATPNATIDRAFGRLGKVQQ